MQLGLNLPPFIHSVLDCSLRVWELSKSGRLMARKDSPITRPLILRKMCSFPSSMFSKPTVDFPCQVASLRTVLLQDPWCTSDMHGNISLSIYFGLGWVSALGGPLVCGHIFSCLPAWTCVLSPPFLSGLHGSWQLALRPKLSAGLLDLPLLLIRHGAEPMVRMRARTFPELRRTLPGHQGLKSGLSRAWWAPCLDAKRAMESAGCRCANAVGASRVTTIGGLFKF